MTDENGLTDRADAVELGERIRQVRITHRLSEDAFSESLSIGKSSLRRYERGERDADAPFLIGLCRRYNIDPRWLLMGWGSPRAHIEQPQSGAAAGALDLDLMREVIRALESLLDAEGLRLAPAKKAEAAVTLYELIHAEQHGPVKVVDLSKYRNVIRLAR